MKHLEAYLIVFVSFAIIASVIQLAVFLIWSNHIDEWVTNFITWRAVRLEIIIIGAFSFWGLRDVRDKTDILDE